MKKTLSLLLALVLLLSVASFASAEEEKTLRVFYTTGHTASAHTDLILAWIEEQLGCKYELNVGDSSNFEQQLALYLASGDMPDIVWCNYTTWAEYAAQGAWADISEYLEEYPDLKNYPEDQSVWALMAVNGEGVYGVPNTINIDSNLAMFIRQDWLDNLGLDMPQTIDEYADVIRAFTQNDPDQDGEDDTYGIVAASYKHFTPFLGAFGAVADEHYFLNEEGKVVTNAISENYREGLRWLRELYAEGCIDPDSLSDPGFGPAGWCNGEDGIYSCAWSWAAMVYPKKDFGILNPTAQVEGCPMPVGENGEAGNLFQGAFSTVVAVSATSDDETKDLAAKMLNLAATDEGFWTTFLGIKGLYWDYDENGKIVSWNNNGGYLLDGTPMDVASVEMYKLLYHEKEQATLYDASLSEKDRLLVDGDRQRQNNPYYKNLFAYLTTDEMVELGSTTANYFHQSMIEFLKGEKDLDTDWDEYVTTYLSMGGEAIRQSLLELYNATYGTDYVFAD
ncbi:MAG: extracellular solute-binding protein [Clostridia bacterium]|nr:extracellular solute-binding protein [Clostridia bacterium]